MATATTPASRPFDRAVKIRQSPKFSARRWKVERRNDIR